jgi:hypothetical protein
MISVTDRVPAARPTTCRKEAEEIRMTSSAILRLAVRGLGGKFTFRTGAFYNLGAAWQSMPRLFSALVRI